MKWKGRRQSKHIEIAPRDDVAEAIAKVYGHLTPIDKELYDDTKEILKGPPIPTPKPTRVQVTPKKKKK